MAKILLVEDDKSLREIYGVRLMAEGYEIVSAGDGEEALAMAIKERPDLIVSDVMMPKISGFDMLDILRSTSETKDVKVIMMTALSSDDQRARGEALGADRYLVKSQVGIEDVVRTVHDVLGDSISAAPATAPTPVAAPAPLTPAPTPVATPAVPVAPADPVAAGAPAPVAPAQPLAPAPLVAEPPVAPTSAPLPSAPAPQPQPAFEPTPAAAPSTPAVSPAPVPQPMAPTPVAPIAPAYETATPPAAPAAPVDTSAPSPTLTELPANPAPLPQPTAPFSSPAPASLGERVIEPLTSDLSTTGPLDIASQMAQALGSDPQTSTNGTGTPPVPPTV